MREEVGKQAENWILEALASYEIPTECECITNKNRQLSELLNILSRYVGRGQEPPYRPRQRQLATFANWGAMGMGGGKDSNWGWEEIQKEIFGICLATWEYGGLYACLFKKYINGIVTCILSCKNRIASLCPTQDTACLGLVHSHDPERCYGEEGGRGVHVWERMYTRGGFISMYGKTNTVL